MSANRSPLFDAVIVGSGAGGCAAAYRLASAGLRVAVVEKGKELPRDASTLDFDKVVHQGSFKSKELWRDGRGRQFAPEEYFNVGGKTKWYGAALLRYGRHEFDADPAHQCLAWPIGYEELRPYYEEAEALLGIRTFATEPDLQRIVARLQSNSPIWKTEPLPLGLASSILDHPLEAARFDGFASAAGLKSDGETVFLSRLRSMPNVSLLTGVAVVDLIGKPGSPQRITGVRLEDGRVLQAEAVLLAAGALHSPRILARYLERSGLADVLPSAQVVGRNLKLHLLTAVIALSAIAQDRSDPQDDIALERRPAPQQRAAARLRRRAHRDARAQACAALRGSPDRAARLRFLSANRGRFASRQSRARRRSADAGLRRRSTGQRGARAPQAGQHFPVCVGSHRHADVLAADRVGRYGTRLRDAPGGYRSAAVRRGYSRTRARLAFAVRGRWQRLAEIEPRQSVAHDLFLEFARGAGARAGAARTPIDD